MLEPSSAANYDPALVVLSVAVAILTAYIAADISWRTSASDIHKTSAYWPWIGGIVLSLGAWAAHVVGMLAAGEHFSFTYRLDITVLSLLLTLAGIGSALYLVYRCGTRSACILGSGALMGLGLVAMCFTGMHSVLMPGMEHSYDYGMVALSYVVAAGFSTPAVIILQRFYSGGSVHPGRDKVEFALLMGSAIIGMHYTDMASMQMTMPVMADMPDMPDMPNMRGMTPDLVSNNAMAVAIAVVVATIMLVALWSSHQYQWVSLREKRLLEQTKEYTDAILSNVVIGLIVIDEGGLIQSMNPAAENVFGYPTSELIGRDVTVLMPESYRSQHAAYLLRYLKTGDSRVIGAGPRELEGVRKDGTVFPLEIAISEVHFGARRLFTGLVRDITQRKEAEAHLTYMAHHDALTGLLSRALFYDRATQALRHADRTERLVAILYLDLDRFKGINDTLGHDMGDRLLREVARRITACLRSEDSVARLGGDEFTIVLESMTSTDDIISIARKILASVAEPLVLENRTLRITASIGVTVYPFDDKDIDDLLRHADLAMYRAKQSGRNNFQLYSTDMTSARQATRPAAG